MLRSWARGHAIAVTVLCLAFFLQCLLASRGKSPVWDEPVHIVSGAQYIADLRIAGNLQHPPLVKELAGLSLALSGIHWKGDTQYPRWEWDAAKTFLTDAGIQRTLFRARLPLILLTPFFALLVYAFSRELAGPRAALGALFLFASDPTMVAHSYLVTTDAAVTAGVLLFLFALFRYLQNPSARRLAWAGLALGIALNTKFSAVFLLPIGAALLLAGAPQQDSRGRIVFTARALAIMGAISLVVIDVVYFSWRGPYLYLLGLHRVNADHVAGFLYYFGGNLKERFYSYFAAAWLLKEPLDAIALALGGWVLIVRSRGLKSLTKWFLLLPPAVFFLACTVSASDIGIRYEMPALAFGYLAGGIALAALWSGGIPSRALALAACAWVAVAAIGIYPDHLSYFNELACLPDHTSRIGLDGGSRCGADWLADSNVDWGQSLPQLKAWMDAHAAGRPVRLVYFGYVSPEAYGLSASPVDKIMQPLPAPGLYAVSAHHLAYGLANPELDWLREEPAAIVGHAYYIFDIGTQASRH